MNMESGRSALIIPGLDCVGFWSEALSPDSAAHCGADRLSDGYLGVDTPG